MTRHGIAASLAFMALMAGNLLAQRQVTTFEMRYLTKGPKANGVTDFHGETEWLDTEGRVDALNRYADYASHFWGDPGLDTPLFSDEDVKDLLSSIKPQPLTSIRRTIRLEEWKAYGYKAGKEASDRERWSPSVSRAAPRAAALSCTS